MRNLKQLLESGQINFKPVRGWDPKGGIEDYGDFLCLEPDDANFTQEGVEMDSRVRFFPNQRITRCKSASPGNVWYHNGTSGNGFNSPPSIHVQLGGAIYTFYLRPKKEIKRHMEVIPVEIILT